MTISGPAGSAAQEGRRDRLWVKVRRALTEFLLLPIFIMTLFVTLAVGSYLLDMKASAGNDPLREYLRHHLFVEPDVTANLLAVVAAGLITVTSIVMSLLLVAVQQSANAMSLDVFDQFLRRRENQFYFGFFIGLALFSMLTLATTHDQLNPVYGGTLALLLSSVALGLLIVLMYTTVNQMRPAVVIGAIKQHALSAKRRQRDLVLSTRCPPEGTSVLDERSGKPVYSRNHGHVTRIHIETIEKALRAEPEAVVTLDVRIGTFIACGDRVAAIRNARGEELAECVLGAIRLGYQRDVTYDAAYGVQQIEFISWTSISSAKANPGPGLEGLRALRDVLAVWTPDQVELDRERDLSNSRILYSDPAYDSLFDAFEALGSITAESWQHQSLSEVFKTIRSSFEMLPERGKKRFEEVILRLIPPLGKHVLTRRLEASIADLLSVLHRTGRTSTASALQEALDEMKQTVGHLPSAQEK